jgi:tetratricopeptide (TPR) repeat protein
VPSASELQQRAIDYAKSGDFGADALATNLELARLVPTNEGAWTRLSRCYMEHGQLDEAAAALDAVLQLNPQNTLARSLQMEVTRRRVAATAPPPRAPRAKAGGSARTEKVKGPAAGGFARAEFATLGRLAPAAALDALGGRIEALLMALNERPFAAKAVETRNRAGQSGARLFRRNTIQARGPGCLHGFHQGGRREPQLNMGFLSATPFGRDAVRAGIAFDLMPDGATTEHERALAYFAQFQQFVAGAWRGFLSRWMSGTAGFIQYGDRPPSTDLMPDDALGWLINCRNPAEIGWVFFGRWLFADRLPDSEILADGRKLIAWSETSLSDLLPLWSSLYRG